MIYIETVLVTKFSRLVF